MPTQPVNLYDFRPSDSNSDTALILAAVAEINKTNSTALNIQFPRRTLILEEVPVITGKNVTLNGFGCILRNNTTPQFFKLGDNVTKAINVNITGFQLWCPADIDPFSDPPTSAGDTSFDTIPNPAQSVFAIEMHNADYCRATQIICTGLASAIKFGSNTTTASRCVASEWLGDFNNGINSDANILIVNGSAGKILNFNIAGVYTAKAAVPGVSPARVGGSVNGALIKIAPVGDAIVDTWEFKVLLAIFDHVSSTNGKPYGVHIDRRFAPVTNIWFQSGTAIDHTEVIAFYFQANGSIPSDVYSRNIMVESSRFATDAGRGILIDNNSGSTLQSCSFDRIITAINVGTDPVGGINYAFECRTPGNVSEVTLSNSRILGVGTQKAGPAVRMAGNGWSCFNNKIRGANEAQNWDNGYVFIGNGEEHDNEFQARYNSTLEGDATDDLGTTWMIP
jgi:hypothetical protein